MATWQNYPQKSVGKSVPRREDFKFLTGAGRFIDDLSFPGALHCHMVRSPHAHARIRSMDISHASAGAGVAAVFTGVHMEADGIGSMECLWVMTSKDGTPMAEPPRWALARGSVRHVGEPVAVVIAATRNQAADAAELIEIDYEELPAVTKSSAALAIGAPQLHRDGTGNICYDWERGDAAAVAAAFAAADQIVAVDILNNRLVGAAIETRGVAGEFDPTGGTLTLYSTTQTVHHIRRAVAAQLGMAQAQLRVISPDMGGGFGNKGKHYPEETIVAWAAKRLGRPLKWIGQRHESFVSDTQGRDHETHAELALDAAGNFLGLRVKTLANLGAYVSTFGANIPSAIYSTLLAGVYKTPAIHVEITGVFTNTVPTDAYRGAGRPEACYVLERLADRAAAATGQSRAEIRRRNLIPGDAMPYTTPIGPVYDSGDFPAIMQKVLENSDFDGLEAREPAPAGTLKGVGLACFVESSGVAPSRLAGIMGARVGFFETAQIRVEPDGSVRAMLGTHNHGQGHATTFAQILSDRLGVDADRIEVLEGDTAMVPNGTGTFGSRSIAVGGSALDDAAGKIIQKGRKIAAQLLEATPSDIEFTDGVFSIAGTDRKLSFDRIAKEAYAPFNLSGEALEPGLDETAFYDPSNFAFSNGAHVAEVEIDQGTGAVRITGYWVVDDIGIVINPMVVEGQVHGGLAQGIGQVLLEATIYDAGNGQMLSGSFMDYAMPRADDLPHFHSELDQSQPCTHNPLGAKGCGESGAIGAPAAVMSAILDALAPYGVTDIEMPATPERVWRAMNDTGVGA